MSSARRGWLATIVKVSFVSLLLFPVEAVAQSIGGSVTDSSGLVLPGVTVTASSPALIEQSRTVVTDGEGRYRIVELRPGIYTVTLALQGFRTVEREGIELVTGFTASVNAQLEVGAIEETITVTGASPVVDTQSVETQSVLTRPVLDALPNTKTFAQFAMVTPGVRGGAAGGVDTRDVGGVQGEAPLGLRAHGSDSGLTSVDGIMTVSMAGGDWRRLNLSDHYTQEVVLQVSGGDAEAWTGGVNVNVIPKDGGNTFSGTIFGNWGDGATQSNNVSDELVARGLSEESAELLQLFDVGGGIGGPIIKDRLWFYVGPRMWRTESNVPGNFFNLTPNTLFYTPDPDRPATFGRKNWDASGRVTWQVSDNHKIASNVINSYQCFCPFATGGGRVSPAGAAEYLYWPQRLVSGRWTHTASNRLLIEGGFAWRTEGVTSQLSSEAEVTRTSRSILEFSINRRYGSHTGLMGPTDYGESPSTHLMGSASVSYVTGSHNFKVGVSTLNADEILFQEPNFAEAYNFFNQVPISLWQLASPNRTETIFSGLGLYAQDQWTIDRLTLNLGVRLETINGRSPDQTRPGGVYLDTLSFTEVKNIPNWKNIHPRLGAAFDLSGNGRTALKVQFGRYQTNDSYSLALTRRNAPPNTLVTRTIRQWDDGNGNFVPDCDLQNRFANGECGGMADQGFGTTRVSRFFDQDILDGWGVDPNFWVASVSVQHELARNVGLSVAYFHTWHTNQTLTDNLSVTQDDFDPYCITAPVDSQLPGGGGNEVCGLFDVSFDKFGQSESFVTHAGGWSDTFDGLDATVTGRFDNGALVTGGIATGRQVTDECDVPDAPAQFCRETLPWSQHLEFKFSGVYPLPWWGIQVSGVVQNLPGRVRAVTYVASNAEIAPSLGRNVSSCPAPTGPCSARSVVTIVAPNSFAESRGNQTDVRASKIFNLAGVRLQGNLDLFNLFNSSDVLSVTGRLGPAFSATEQYSGRSSDQGGSPDGLLASRRCIAPGFLDSGLTVFASTQPRPAQRGRVAPGRGCDSRISRASTACCTSV